MTSPKSFTPRTENKADFFDAKNIAIPFATSVFPDERYQAPRSWAERAYPHNLIHYNKLDRVRQATKEREIDYPVAVDNDQAREAAKALTDGTVTISPTRENLLTTALLGLACTRGCADHDGIRHRPQSSWQNGPHAARIPCDLRVVRRIG